MKGVNLDVPSHIFGLPKVGVDAPSHIFDDEQGDVQSQKTRNDALLIPLWLRLRRRDRKHDGAEDTRRRGRREGARWSGANHAAAARCILRCASDGSPGSPLTTPHGFGALYRL
eukprot:gene18978-biopygen6952